MSDTYTSLDYALALYERGLSVIPIPRPDGHHDGKRPTIAWKRYQTERAAETQVREWFREPANVGIVTGAVSNVVVVDIDSEAAAQWVRRNLPRPSWRQRTGKGLHLFYRHPGGTVRNGARIETRDGRLPIDIRGDGGFVVGPGSVHASGHVYTAEGDWSVPSSGLPAFWRGWLQRDRPASATPVARPARPESDSAQRARAYLLAIPRPFVGQGSDAATFYAACRLVRGFGLSADSAVDLLQEWAPDFDRWWLESKVRCAEKYGTEQLEGYAR